METHEIKIFKLMSQGLTQIEVSKELIKQGYKASSLSSIEKKIKSVRREYKANTNFKLALILRAKKII